MKYFLTLLTSFISLYTATSYTAMAEESFIQWHDTNIQLLRGWDYDVTDNRQTIATFEHANGWTYGDFFMFIDYAWPDKGESNYYAEFSPRISLSKVTGYNFSYGIIKDVLISTTIDKPENQTERYLYGGAIDLNLPHFDFFKANTYVRDDPSLRGETWQVTLAWKAPFTIGNTSWVSEGFMDFTGEEDTSARNELLVPRLLLDVGALTGIAPNKLWAGVEWQHWHNKFGIEGKSESVPQLQVKWVF